MRRVDDQIEQHLRQLVSQHWHRRELRIELESHFSDQLPFVFRDDAGRLDDGMQVGRLFLAAARV
jgi:hypothetical protein